MNKLKVFNYTKKKYITLFKLANIYVYQNILFFLLYFIKINFFLLIILVYKVNNDKLNL